MVCDPAQRTLVPGLRLLTDSFDARLPGAV
jgi:hypothetical protein